MKKQHWSARLHLAREAAGSPSWAELARRTAIPAENLRKYANGSVDQPRGDTLEKIAEALNVPVLWLRDGTAPGTSSTLGIAPSKTPAPKGENENAVLSFEALGSKRATYDASARIPEFAAFRRLEPEEFLDPLNEEPQTFWHIPNGYLDTDLKVRSENVVMLEITSDNMAPTLTYGDRVLVNLKDKNVIQPGIFCIWENGSTIVRRLETVPGSVPQKLRRTNDNPYYHAYEVPIAETHIIGRVVWYGRKL